MTVTALAGAGFTGGHMLSKAQKSTPSETCSGNSGELLARQYPIPPNRTGELYAQ